MPSPPVRLLAAHEPPVFQVREAGASPWLVTVDHAGRRLPQALGTLGLSAEALASHVAWDIGAAGVGARLADELDAFSIMQTYSRLVIDCNRPPGTEQSIVRVSEATRIPGNQDLSPADREARAREIFQPYHQRIGEQLDARPRAILVALHSFTPRYLGVDRPWHMGVLYHRDARLGRRLLELLRAAGTGELVVGDNQPYSVGDDTDYTIPVHGERRGIAHVALEIRQDLLAGAAAQAAWATRLAGALGRAAAELLP